MCLRSELLKGASHFPKATLGFVARKQIIFFTRFLLLPGDWQRLRNQADPSVILMAAADDSILPGDWQRLRNQADPNVIHYEYYAAPTGLEF